MFGVINRVDKVIWRLQRDSSADISSVSPSSERRENSVNLGKSRKLVFKSFNKV